MSMYNYLFGINKDADVLLGVISMSMKDFGRFRDIYLNPEGNIITVLSRTGGNNRKEYKTYIKNAKNNKLYIKDYDDKADSTYMYFEFNVPEEYLKMCKSIAPKEKELTVGEKFDKELKEMEIEGSDASKRAKNLANKILNSDSTTDVFFI